MKQITFIGLGLLLSATSQAQQLHKTFAQGVQDGSVCQALPTGITVHASPSSYKCGQNGIYSQISGSGYVVLYAENPNNLKQIVQVDSTIINQFTYNGKTFKCNLWHSDTTPPVWKNAAFYNKVNEKLVSFYICGRTQDFYSNCPAVMKPCPKPPS